MSLHPAVVIHPIVEKKEHRVVALLMVRIRFHDPLDFMTLALIALEQHHIGNN